MIRKANENDIEYILSLTRLFANDNESTIRLVLDDPDNVVEIDEERETVARIWVNHEKEETEVIWFLPHTKTFRELQPAIVGCIKELIKEHPSAKNWPLGGIFTSGRGCLKNDPREAAQIVEGWNNAFNNTLVIRDLTLKERLSRGLAPSIISPDKVRKVYSPTAQNMIDSAKYVK